jgi:DNA-binding Lrp family transcriptional regulator
MTLDDLRGIDEKSKRFMRALVYYGGEATTTEIRKRTGLDSPVTHYRYNKLEECGAISVSYADNGVGQRHVPKVAELTGLGRKAVNKGFFEPGSVPGDEDDGPIAVSEEEFRELGREVEELQNRVNVLVHNGEGGGGDADLEAVVARVEERVEELGAGGSAGVAEAPAVRTIERRVGELEADVDAFEEYVYDWHESAELYMRALHRAVEDELGVSLDSYYDSGDGAGEIGEGQ